MIDDTICLRELSVSIRFSRRRKILALTVKPNGDVILSAPEGYERSGMERFVRSKLSWIYSKIAEKKKLPPPPPDRRFVSGESYPFKGNWFRLRFENEQGAPLSFDGEWFSMLRRERGNAKEHFLLWYMKRTKDILKERFDLYAARIGVTEATFGVRELGTRWAIRYPTESKVDFHWVIASLPVHIIDYLFVREMLLLVYGDGESMKEKLNCIFFDDSTETWLKTESRCFVISL
jgi:predicted metal-dependent hydrolase